MTYRPRAILVPAVLAALLLSGCTAGGADIPSRSPSSVASRSSGPGESDGADGQDEAQADAAAGATSEVLAEQTFDATVRSVAAGSAGGTVTATLRALEVEGQTMTLRWAFRWDNPDSADDATVTLDQLGVGVLPMLTDTVNLKQYRPLCAEGSWQGGITDSMVCSRSVLVSPKDVLYMHIANHTTMEGWAVFAAPQDAGMIADVALVDGWPTFSAVTPTESE